MINETILVKEYLDGKNINVKIIYRICYLLAKWYKESGIDSKALIRKNILNWANQYGVNVNINLNDCIDRALNNPRRLTYDNPIRISNADIKEITDRFDNKNVRIVALAILCYAKQFANQNSEFELPISAFGVWIGIDASNILKRYLPELIDYEYIQKLDITVTRTYAGVAKSKSNRYKIKVPIINKGEYTLNDNNILVLYSEIFKK